MPSVPLPIGSYNQPSRVPARLVNVYPQQTIGKGPVELVGAPGIVPFSDLGDAEGRGLYVMRGSLYGVAGSTLYRIAENGSPTSLGTLPGSGKLMFAGNGSDIVFSNKYAYASGVISAIADPDLPAISAIDFVDGFVVYAESATGRWGCSALNNLTDYNALDYATAEGYPDDLVTLKVDHRQVLLFGQETTETAYLTDQSGFPFARMPGSFLEYGCLARLGVAKQDNSVFWLAHDRTIRRLTGQTPVRVSQHGVEEKLASYSRVDDCEAFPYTWNGHLFVVFRFPAAQATWVFDVTTGEWHERASYGSSMWNIVDAAHCYGKIFVQHSETGAVGYLSDTTYTEFSETLRREWTYPQVYATNRRLFHSSLEVIGRSGDAPIGVVPHIQLDISDDGGNTWLALPSREFGRVGEYDHLVRWNRLGMARDRVYRCSVSDSAIPVKITDTVLEVA